MRTPSLLFVLLLSTSALASPVDGKWKLESCKSNFKAAEQPQYLNVSSNEDGITVEFSDESKENTSAERIDSYDEYPNAIIAQSYHFETVSSEDDISDHRVQFVQDTIEIARHGDRLVLRKTAKRWGVGTRKFGLWIGWMGNSERTTCIYNFETQE